MLIEAAIVGSALTAVGAGIPILHFKKKKSTMGLPRKSSGEVVMEKFLFEASEAVVNADPDALEHKFCTAVTSAFPDNPPPLVTEAGVAVAKHLDVIREYACEYAELSNEDNPSDHTRLAKLYGEIARRVNDSVSAVQEEIKYLETMARNMAPENLSAMRDAIHVNVQSATAILDSLSTRGYVTVHRRKVCDDIRQQVEESKSASTAYATYVRLDAAEQEAERLIHNVDMDRSRVEELSTSADTLLGEIDDLRPRVDRNSNLYTMTRRNVLDALDTMRESILNESRKPAHPHPLEQSWRIYEQRRHDLALIRKWHAIGSGDRYSIR
jgi:DNA-binding MarR family transcriptional regulator